VPKKTVNIQYKGVGKDNLLGMPSPILTISFLRHKKRMLKTEIPLQIWVKKRPMRIWWMAKEEEKWRYWP